MRAKQLTRFLMWSYIHKKNVLIKGAPGVGKTDVVHQASELLAQGKSLEMIGIPFNMKVKIIVLHPVVSDPTDFKGLPFVINGKAVFLPFGDLEEMMNVPDDTLLIVFFDDLGQATPAVQSAVMQLLLARQINGKIISDNVVFVAATNRRQDKANVSGILEPVKSRFLSIVEMECNHEDWIEWALKNKMPHELVSFIQFRPNMLLDFKPTRDIENSPSPRTNASVGFMIANQIPDDLRFEAIMGAAGEAYAIEFEAYRRVYLTLPTISEIANNPRSTPIPNELSAKFAICGLIMDKMTTANASALITYTERMEKEFQIATVKNVFDRNPAIRATPAFLQWAIKNGRELTEV